jgi:NADH-quinone oxidoreductase subunit D
MWQSLSIIKQAIDKLPDGPFHAKVAGVLLAPKEEVYNNMEALIYHFKIVMGETDIPKGEVYHCVEGGNGELGFYLISDGGRTHSVCNSEDLASSITRVPGNDQRVDAVGCDMTMSSMNVIAGELDA